MVSIGDENTEAMEIVYIEISVWEIHSVGLFIVTSHL